MPVQGNTVQFKYGLYANYLKFPTKDPNTIYFATDQQRMFVGDTEYTRVIFAYDKANEPSTGIQGEMYVLVGDYDDDNSSRDLYLFTSSTEKILVAHLPAAITGGVFGDTTKTATFGGTITIPRITVDSRGAITAVSNSTITLPTETAETKNTVTVTGSGNAVTAASYDEAGHALTLTKGESFATSSELSAVDNRLTTVEGKPAIGITSEQITKWDKSLEANAAITGATHTKITYDAKGLVTAGEDLSASDIPNLNASKINAGTFDAARIPTLSITDKVTGYGTAALKDVATTAIESASTDTNLVTAQQVATFVTTSVAGLAGAMHFVGTSTTDPKGETGATVAGHTKWAAGDVVLYGSKEYVLSGTTNTAANWKELGDETSYAIKGSIVNSDIAANAAIDQSKINGLTDALASKATPADILSAMLTHEANNHKDLTIGTKTYDGSQEVTITKSDLGLGNVDNTADANKSVKSAATLTTARTIGISGAVTGTATSFDGSENITINATAVDGAKVTGIVPKATADAAGNDISATYATKEEVTAATLVWGTF